MLAWYRALGVEIGPRAEITPVLKDTEIGARIAQRSPGLDFEPIRAETRSVGGRSARLAAALAAGILWAAVGAGATSPEATALQGLDGDGVRLLVVAPHPDDAELAAGGLIRRIARHGTVQVIHMTSGDGFAPGVARETQHPAPAPRDFLLYARRREAEAVCAEHRLGVPRAHVIFLGFPDRGLCPILRRFRTDRPPYFRSPFTDEDRPPADEALVPGEEYDAPDLEHELRQIIARFRPTIVVVPHWADEHPDHCATWFFLREVLDELEADRPGFHPTLLAYLIHFPDWPEDVGPVLSPPARFPSPSEWISVPLSTAEADAKRDALACYRTQMEMMAHYLLGFARQNELFVRDPDQPGSGARDRCCGSAG